MVTETILPLYTNMVTDCEKLCGVCIENQIRDPWVVNELKIVFQNFNTLT